MKVKIDSSGHLIYYYDEPEQDSLELSQANGKLYYLHTADAVADYSIASDHLYYMLPIIFALITDRTQADVDYVRTLAAKGVSGMTQEELTQWLSDLKGTYNASDLNRVGMAINFLSRRLVETGYTGASQAKTDWTDSDVWITPQQLARYIDELRTLRDSIPLTGLPALPESYDQLTYQTANNIEIMLELIFEALVNIKSRPVYSGTFESGMLWEEFT